MPTRPVTVRGSRPGGAPRTSFFGAEEAHGFSLVFALVLLATAFRVLVLSGEAYPLYGDEAQYWAWSRHLDWGYYSKPPLIAWLIRFGTGWLGEREFGVRALSPFLHGGTALLLYAIGRRLYDARIGFWSALTYVALPAVSLSSLLMSTDVPLLFFWALGILCFVRAIGPAEPASGKLQSGDPRWWLGVGVAIGLGTLSKYSMALFVPSMLLYLAFYQRALLRSPLLWLSIALGCALVVPNMAWNAANDFVSYRHTADNANLHGSLFHPDKLLEFLGGQFGVFGPALFAVLLVLLVARFRWLVGEPRRWLLVSFILPQLLLALVIALLSRANANWAAPIYVSGSVLVVAWALGSREASGRLARWRSWVIFGSVGLHVVLAIGLYGFHDIAHALNITLTAKTDPFRRLMGGRELGRAVQGLLNTTPGVLMTDERMLYAELAFYVPSHPIQAEWSEDGKIHDQFDLDSDARQFKNTTIVYVSRDEAPSALAHYNEVQPLSTITIPLYPDYSQRYHVFLLRGLKG